MNWEDVVGLRLQKTTAARVRQPHPPILTTTPHYTLTWRTNTICVLCVHLRPQKAGTQMNAENADEHR